MQKYFYSINNSNTLHCVTNCSTENKYYINCNKGQCSVTNTGPHCYCEISDQFWYTGDRCQIPISKPGVYGGVAAGLAVLLIIIIILAIVSYRRHQGPQKKRLIDTEQYWFEDGCEGVYRRNSNIWNPESASNNGSQTTGSCSQNFQPTLQNIDTNVKVSLPRPHVVSHSLD
ncbi:mucin-3A-like [Discoglossus pictus]